jgi:hypothetical protein
MLLPTAMIVAVHAVKSQAGSARPDAPVIGDAAPRFLRTRAVVSRALYASARAVAPKEVRPVRLRAEHALTPR